MLSRGWWASCGLRPSLGPTGCCCSECQLRSADHQQLLSWEESHARQGPVCPWSTSPRGKPATCPWTCETWSVRATEHSAAATTSNALPRTGPGRTVGRPEGAPATPQPHLISSPRCEGRRADHRGCTECDSTYINSKLGKPSDILFRMKLSIEADKHWA